MASTANRPRSNCRRSRLIPGPLLCRPVHRRIPKKHMLEKLSGAGEGQSEATMQHGEFGFLNFGLVLLAAAVLSVPIARRLGLSAIVAYLIAGIIIGPYGLAAFGTPESIIPVSELGVVMLLFLIGLELELGRLLAMRRAIFGLGAAQLALTALAIGALGYAAGLVDWRGAVIVGLALAMSATAIALQILEERGQLQQDYGQRAFAILLFQDMAVVPLLAVLPLLAPGSGSAHANL